MYAIHNEKQKGDKEIIRSHLEDFTVHSEIGLVVSNYYIQQGGDFLEIHLEPFCYIDHPLDYYIEFKHNSKREMEWVSISKGGFLSAYISPRGIIRNLLGGKCTKLYVRPQKRKVKENG